MRTHSLVLASLLAPAVGLAQTPLPGLVRTGLDSLRVGHCEAALGVWTSSWTSPEDLTKRQTLIDSCGMLSRLGTPYGYDIARAAVIGPNVLRVYAVLRYDTQPVYFLVEAYRPSDHWKVTGVFWNTSPTKLPPTPTFSRDSAGP
jgi:hypothetical protein